MTVDETSSILERSEHLYKLISSERFLKKQGLGNEVPFFICPYRPEDGIEMKQMERRLIKRLAADGITVLYIDLYILTIELLQKRGIWDRILKIEQQTPKDKLKELLQGVLDPEQHLIPAIAQKMAEETFDVMFLSGAGEVFPYIRSHHVLNNLQSAAKDKPTVLFFPGRYTHSLEGGASLDLFGRLHDDKYYRAFNIYHCEI
ncbi:MAG TPA: DUF1788 domain-containing protein [Anaerolineaceae bacterium]|nr:DUF1788 domain-containing protein [Anaerolineaceae bacterium]HPN52275.1 DUF1788 domain-containing protein [Anaerolineaceae bacterium]